MTDPVAERDAGVMAADIGLMRWDWEHDGMCQDAGGRFVRYEAAAAALAAKDAALEHVSSHWRAEIAALAAEKARGDGLAEALQPFADALDDIDFADDAIKDNWSIWERPEAMGLTVGHLRAAKRAALSVQPEETNP